MIGTGLPDDNMHAPNEKYHLPNYYHGIRQAVRFLDILGRDPAVLARPQRMAGTASARGARGASAANGAANGGNAQRPARVSRSKQTTETKA